MTYVPFCNKVQCFCRLGGVIAGLNRDCLNHYRHGVFTKSMAPANCITGQVMFTDLGDVTTVVGWGKDHWIIKGSFGQIWGENGYARVAFDADCGLTVDELYVPFLNQLI